MEILLTNCHNCPIMNTSHTGLESGCNLGYHTDYQQFPDGQWYEFSDNCELVEIKTEKEIFYPKPLKIKTPKTNTP